MGDDLHLLRLLLGAPWELELLPPVKLGGLKGASRRQPMPDTLLLLPLPAMVPRGGLCATAPIDAGSVPSCEVCSWDALARGGWKALFFAAVRILVSSCFKRGVVQHGVFSQFISKRVQ